MEESRDNNIVVKYVKIDGQSFENPVPRFEYATKIGTWRLIVESEPHANFFDVRQNQEVEVEVGMQFGVLRDVGKVRIWHGELPDAPSFLAQIQGSDPMSFLER